MLSVPAMGEQLSRRAFLVSLASAAALPVLANPPATSLRPIGRGGAVAVARPPAVEALVSSARLDGTVGFVLADAKTGEVLESLNGASDVPPASVTKAVTALYALDILGPIHRFSTKVIATGGLQNGVIAGDLILVGGGDPTLDTDALAQLAAELKSAGVREVRGEFFVYDGGLPSIRQIDKGQPDHVAYNPAVSGIALNFNRVRFEWRRASSGYTISMDARTQKYRPEVSMARMTLAQRDKPVFDYTPGPKRDTWSVAQSALGRDGARWLPVRLPALYAGDVFRTLARSHGIVLPEPQRVQEVPSGQILAEHQSADLRTMLRAMLKFSNNLMAEMIGLSATAAAGNTTPKSLKSSAKAMSEWAAKTLGMKQTLLVDHSGLGDTSKMTAQDMSTALARADIQSIRPLMKRISLKDAGPKVVVNAKTGTLNFVSSLAGYATMPNGQDVVFAIFTADEATRAKIPRDQRDAAPGARSWNRRARHLQNQLIARWSSMFRS